MSHSPAQQSTISGDIVLVPDNGNYLLHIVTVDCWINEVRDFTEKKHIESEYCFSSPEL